MAVTGTPLTAITKGTWLAPDAWVVRAAFTMQTIRYDKTAESYQAAVTLASLLMWA